jgi:hypothetical protein
VKTRDKRGRLRIKQGLLLAVGKISKARGVTMCYFRRNKRVSEHEKQELQKRWLRGRNRRPGNCVFIVQRDQIIYA